jgi:hypothetical protein
MATSSFYNDNLYRSYPFVAENSLGIGPSEGIPHEWLAGIKVRMNDGAGFLAFPSVYLTDWRTDEKQHVLTFSCEADGRTVSKTVAIPAHTPPFTRIVSDANERIQIALIAGSLPTAPLVKPGLRLRVEPTCILWLIHRGIASVQVGNRARKVLPLPDGVEHEYYGKAQWWQQGEPGGEQTIVNKPLLFSPGFNCRLYPRVGNRLQFEAGSRLGLGEVQTDLSKGFAKVSGTMISEEEAMPVSYLRKDGLPNDSEVLYAFCGAVGPHVRMTATSTIRLTAEPEKHTITISVGNLGGDIC